jgi:hypothetical protein
VELNAMEGRMFRKVPQAAKIRNSRAGPAVPAEHPDPGITLEVNRFATALLFRKERTRACVRLRSFSARFTAELFVTGCGDAAFDERARGTNPQKNNPGAPRNSRPKQ